MIFAWGYKVTPQYRICYKNMLVWLGLNNTEHVLHPLLPPQNPNKYTLRPRVHTRYLPKLTHVLFNRSFFPRNLYTDKY